MPLALAPPPQSWASLTSIVWHIGGWLLRLLWPDLLFLLLHEATQGPPWPWPRWMWQ